MSPGGYRWWYLDAESDDGSAALAIILFVGSVFSPYYAWAGRRAPENHVAFNIGLYPAGRRLWTMTERGARHLARSATRFAVGPSAATWTEAGALVLTLKERAAPLPFPVEGRITLTPLVRPGQVFALDARGRHFWQPIAPLARIDVQLARPALRFSGSAYLDANWGSEALEDGFTAWTWARAHTDRAGVILYDALRRDGSQMRLGLEVPPDGPLRPFEPPAAQPLPRARWGVMREVPADPGTVPRVLRTFEDGPFYARSLVETEVRGRPVRAVHESLSLTRFAAPWVRLLLPFRMPRRA